jgi:hypothetical protein
MTGEMQTGSETPKTLAGSVTTTLARNTLILSTIQTLDFLAKRVYVRAKRRWPSGRGSVVLIAETLRCLMHTALEDGGFLFENGFWNFRWLAPSSICKA